MQCTGDKLLFFNLRKKLFFLFIEENYLFRVFFLSNLSVFSYATMTNMYPIFLCLLVINICPVFSSISEKYNSVIFYICLQKMSCLFYASITNMSSFVNDPQLNKPYFLWSTIDNTSSCPCLIQNRYTRNPYWLGSVLYQIEIQFACIIRYWIPC